MKFLYLIFYACLSLQFLDLETRSASLHPVHAFCRILCSNVLGLDRNLSNLTVASSRYHILLCYDTLVSDMHHVSELLVPGFDRTFLLCHRSMPQDPEMTADVRNGCRTY